MPPILNTGAAGLQRSINGWKRCPQAHPKFLRDSIRGLMESSELDMAFNNLLVLESTFGSHPQFPLSFLYTWFAFSSSPIALICLSPWITLYLAGSMPCPCRKNQIVPISGNNSL